MTTWRRLITEEMQEQGESWDDVERCTLSDTELDVRFDNGYGGVEGKPFWLWTSRRVYFAFAYDGSEWASSVPRHPCQEKPEHVGS